MADLFPSEVGRHEPVADPPVSATLPAVMLSQRRCYVAGPMRSRPRYNYPAFFEAERRLRAVGWEVFNPAKMDVEADGAPHLWWSRAQQERHASIPANARHYAQRDLGVIVGILRAENGDAVVLLEGWEQSIGATAERAAALWVGLRVLTLEEALNE